MTAMDLYFYGHDYKYAAEQMLLTLFPEERPVYPEGEPQPGSDHLVLTLREEGNLLTARARLTVGGKTAEGEDRGPLTDAGLERDRVAQRILKLAFYRAGTALLGKEPPWGAPCRK